MSIAGIVTQLGTIEGIVMRGLTAGEAVVETVEAFSGGFFDYEQVRITRHARFKAKNKEEKEAKPILEDIAEQMAQGPGIDTRKDMEIVLRMRLRQQGVKYKNLYLKWLQHQHKQIKIEVKQEIQERKAKKRRKEELAVILALFR